VRTQSADQLATQVVAVLTRGVLANGASG
jgi:hypothetical protein